MLFEWTCSFKIVVVKTLTRSNVNRAIGFPIVQTTVKDSWSFVPSTSLCAILVTGDLGKQCNPLDIRNSCALSYQAPGIFQAVYESKESFEPTFVLSTVGKGNARRSTCRLP